MSRTRIRIIWTLGAALVAAALAPSASVAYDDLRSPDTRDAARASEAQAYQDLRSPDARDAARASDATQTRDLRSPDARDAGRDPAASFPAVTPTSEPSATDWGDVEVVAGGVLGVMLIGLGGLVLFNRRRGTMPKPGTSVVSS